MNGFSYTIQILLYLFIMYYFFSIKASHENRHRMNVYILITLMIVSAYALKGAFVEQLFGVFIVLIILGTSMWFYIQEIRKEKYSVNEPLSYLSFYFLILFIVLITGRSLSLLFPEVFLLAVLFGVTNTGRKISFAISLMSITTIGLLYLHDPVTAGMGVRVGFTILLLLVIPQIAGYIYNTKREQVRREFLDSEERSS